MYSDVQKEASNENRDFYRVQATGIRIVQCRRARGDDSGLAPWQSNSRGLSCPAGRNNDPFVEAAGVAIVDKRQVPVPGYS